MSKTHTYDKTLIENDDFYIKYFLTVPDKKPLDDLDPIPRIGVVIDPKTDKTKKEFVDYRVSNNLIAYGQYDIVRFIRLVIMAINNESNRFRIEDNETKFKFYRFDELDEILCIYDKYDSKENIPIIEVLSKEFPNFPKIIEKIKGLYVPNRMISSSNDPNIGGIRKFFRSQLKDNLKILRPFIKTKRVNRNSEKIQKITHCLYVTVKNIDNFDRTLTSKNGFIKHKFDDDDKLIMDLILSMYDLPELFKRISKTDHDYLKKYIRISGSSVAGLLHIKKDIQKLATDENLSTKEFLNIFITPNDELEGPQLYIKTHAELRETKLIDIFNDTDIDIFIETDEKDQKERKNIYDKVMAIFRKGFNYEYGNANERLYEKGGRYSLCGHFGFKGLAGVHIILNPKESITTMLCDFNFIASRCYYNPLDGTDTAYFTYAGHYAFKNNVNIMWEKDFLGYFRTPDDLPTSSPKWIKEFTRRKAEGYRKKFGYRYHIVPCKISNELLVLGECTVGIRKEYMKKKKIQYTPGKPYRNYTWIIDTSDPPAITGLFKDIIYLDLRDHKTLHPDDMSIYSKMPQIIVPPNDDTETVLGIKSEEVIEKETKDEIIEDEIIKKTYKKTYKKPYKTPYTKTYHNSFTKPVSITDDMCDFMGAPHGSRFSRTQLVSKISSYSREEKITVPGKGCIIPDATLRRLFGTPEKDAKGNPTVIKHSNIQKYFHVNVLKSVDVVEDTHILSPTVIKQSQKESDSDSDSDSEDEVIRKIPKIVIKKKTKDDVIEKETSKLLFFRTPELLNGTPIIPGHKDDNIQIVDSEDEDSIIEEEKEEKEEKEELIMTSVMGDDCSEMPASSCWKVNKGK